MSANQVTCTIRYKYVLRIKLFGTDEDDLHTIVTELKDVTYVLELGLALGVCKPALDQIMQDIAKLQKQKIQVIHYWLTRKDLVQRKQRECLGWDALADAVARVNPALNDMICHHHC